MASGICDRGAPGLLYWLLTGPPASLLLDSGLVEEIQGGGSGDDLDRPAPLVRERDERANRRGGACAAYNDRQGAATAVLSHRDTPTRAAKCAASRRTVGGAEAISSRTSRWTEGRPATSSCAISSAARRATYAFSRRPHWRNARAVSMSRVAFCSVTVIVLSIALIYRWNRGSAL